MLFAHALPVGEGLFRTVHQIEHFSTRESTRDIIICFVPGLLKIDKCHCHSNDFPVGEGVHSILDSVL